MSTQEQDPARESLAELHVEIRLDESLRAMALADIKAPLMEVSLSASVAERIAGAHLDGRLRDAIRDIRESAARAIALLSGLSDETSLNVDLRVIDVSELVAVCLRAAQPLAKARGVHLETSTAPGSTWSQATISSPSASSGSTNKRGTSATPRPWAAAAAVMENNS